MAVEAQTSITQVRQEMVSNCQWGVAHHAEIYYEEIRPYPLIPKYTLPFTTDCSGFATMMARWSGATDPNGSGFNGYGNTDTMLAHSKHISRDESQPGDFVVFGLNPSTHVVTLVQSAAGGNDAQCVSHGQPGDPIQVPLSVEIAAHSGEPLTFLQLEAAGGGTTGSSSPPAAHPPAVAVSGDGAVHVFWRGLGGFLWQGTGSGSGDLNGTRLGFGPMATAPAAGVDAQGHVYVYWVGTDGNLWEVIWDGSAWQGQFNRGYGQVG
jgi:hypothetical protein